MFYRKQIRFVYSNIQWYHLQMLNEFSELGLMAAPVLLAISDSVRKLVISRQDGKCGDCGSPVKNKLEIHHKVPKSEGGGDHPGNLIGLCGEGFKDCHNKWDEIAIKNGTLPDGTPLSQEKFRQRLESANIP